MEIQAMINGLLSHLVKSKKTSIADPTDYSQYLDNHNWSNLFAEINKIKVIHKDKPGVYVLMGCLGNEVKNEIDSNDNLQGDMSINYDTCLYIGKSLDVGGRLYDHFASKKSQIIPNAIKKGYTISNLNPRRIEGLHSDEETDGEFEEGKIYISNLHIFTFDNNPRGLAGRDICEILLIQRPDDPPYLNREFAYREFGIEKTTT